MEEFKLYKETESQIHEALYDNLSLLSAFYPMTEKFSLVFRRDMFVKNNKAAFHEVIYYLLQILDPVKAGEIFSSWPLIDLKEEPKFRNDLLAYVNTLNTVYPNTDIPKCQASSLISPGGFNFAFFMLKISQLVIFEHLRQNGQTPLSQIKGNHQISSPIKIQEENLKKETMYIESITSELFEEFKKKLISSRESGLEITEQIKMSDQDICTKRKKLKNDKVEFIKKFPKYPPLASLENEIMQLKSQIDKIINLSKTFQLNENLLKWLCDTNVTLEYNEEAFAASEDVAIIITSKKELDLCQYFQALLVFLEKKSVEFQRPIDFEALKLTRADIQSQIKKNEDILKKFKIEGERINKILDYLSENN
ncbi:HAUS augmin-like complex subunit 6 [Anthonomus grandis grandis]|uniref:HAUS augmin-like complex subunit 6 n=1 Tax=Anthonomus grandis grandis TaxID=2921223 RepID=UPI002165D314|nr:HAUS augmin-like complex subunit 6 [Anthonomus grandis grandis]XP_050301627.1 HAUS augmin-like complex subunit 6 [Anthonomus grandis grandis]